MRHDKETAHREVDLTRANSKTTQNLVEKTHFGALTQTTSTIIVYRFVHALKDIISMCF